ncbi:MAG TPA: C40 family peptidase [Capsulimonadaceae bacterium]
MALHSGSIVRAATAFEGTRYRFGGTSRSGFDCSGFTRYILGNTAGVEIPRTAMEQYNNGAPVSRSEMKAGDLVFFKNTYRHGISHVGIYTGNGNFVHAANSHRGVVVESLDSAYYANRFAGARRVTGRE